MPSTNILIIDTNIFVYYRKFIWGLRVFKLADIGMEILLRSGYVVIIGDVLQELKDKLGPADEFIKWLKENVPDTAFNVSTANPDFQRILNTRVLAEYARHLPGHYQREIHKSKVFADPMLLVYALHLKTGRLHSEISIEPIIVSEDKNTLWKMCDVLRIKCISWKLFMDTFVYQQTVKH